jgi:hypothetical protein
MEEMIIEATILALRSVRHARFFRTERGYQGRFFCALQEILEEFGILNDDLILEMEYQKSVARHHMNQRPDIVLHIPTEVSNAPPNKNNFAAWALKCRANPAHAQDDFRKLDELFLVLDYPLGFFVNIDSDSHHLLHYSGNYPDRLIAYAVQLNDRDVSIRGARWVRGEISEF